MSQVLGFFPAHCWRTSNKSLGLKHSLPSFFGFLGSLLCGDALRGSSMQSNIQTKMVKESLSYYNNQQKHVFSCIRFQNNLFCFGIGTCQIVGVHFCYF